MQYVIVSKNLGLGKITYLCIQYLVYSNKSQKTRKDMNENYLEAKEKKLESRNVRLNRESENRKTNVYRESSCDK